MSEPKDPDKVDPNVSCFDDTELEEGILYKNTEEEKASWHTPAKMKKIPAKTNANHAKVTVHGQIVNKKSARLQHYGPGAHESGSTQSVHGTWKQADNVARGQLMAIGETPESIMPKGLSEEEFKKEFKACDPHIPDEELEKSWKVYEAMQKKRV
jgi:hypothetical protein